MASLREAKYGYVARYESQKIAADRLMGRAPSSNQVNEPLRKEAISSLRDMQKGTEKLNRSLERQQEQQRQARENSVKKSRDRGGMEIDF